jgi:hypothetical protein
MSQANTKKDALPTQARLVVEVDGNPIGVLDLDLDRLWPLIHPQQREVASAEWMDPNKFDSFLRAVVTKRLLSRMESSLYRTLGEEIVKAELDAESFTLKADAAAQEFGKSKADIEKLAAESGRTPGDFDAFFWEYLLEDREVTDLKKEWKAKDTAPR